MKAPKMPSRARFRWRLMPCRRRAVRHSRYGPAVAGLLLAPRAQRIALGVVRQHRGAFRVRGRQSGKFLGATHDGHVPPAIRGFRK